MHIGILVTGHVADELIEQFGDYPVMFQQLLAGHDFTFSAYNVVDMEFPPDIHAADGWLLTGSKHGAYEDLPFIEPLKTFIRDAYAGPVPMVGICFGHQIIAQALGGRVAKYDGGWSVGATEYQMNGQSVRMNAWHQDQVIERPDDAQVIASSDFCENAALIYGDRAFSVQAHPEIRDDYLEGLLRVRAPGVVPDPLRAEAERLVGTPLDDQRVADQIAAFFKQPRA